MISEANFRSSHRRAPDCYKNIWTQTPQADAHTQTHGLWWNAPRGVAFWGQVYIAQLCHLLLWLHYGTKHLRLLGNGWVSSLVSAWLLGGTLFTGALIHSAFFIDPPYLEDWKRKDGGGKAVTSFRTGPNKGPGACGVVFISLVN